MRYLPIFLDTENKEIIIAGGGEVALAKLRILLKTGARLHVFASKLHDDIVTLEREGRIKVTNRKLRHGDADHARIVYATYFGEALNEEIREIATRAGALINVVDGPEQSDFISPAIVDRDPVVVAIGTEGAAPVLARQIKTDLEARLPVHIGLMARIAKSFRHKVEALPFGRARREFWSDYYAQEIRSEDGARAALRAGLDAALDIKERKGHVSFVGAGPGDAELLTLKARKRLDKADVIIHDRLVSGEILELARREATFINVGKKGYGESWAQEEINALMIEHAAKGALVLRLKGGDASVFGRLDEEIEALRDAKIEFEVVPGITTASAAAASLGQSLTKRGRNSELRILSAREVKGFAEHDWRALAKPGATAAIYMGAKAARFLQGRLLMHGADTQTPITALENVSLFNERMISSTIAKLPDDLERAAPEGPVILLLGIAPHQARELDPSKLNEEIRHAASL